MTSATIFDKFTGDFTSYDATKITVAESDYKVNYYKGWWCLIDGVEHEILSNTSSEFFFSNSLTSSGSFEIIFIGREFLRRIDSDFDDVVKIPFSLIQKKYLISCNEIQLKLKELLKFQASDSFDPLENIINLINLQYPFSYNLAQKIFFDLQNKGGEFYYEKSMHFELSFKSNFKSAIANLIIDKNENNEIDIEEQKKTLSFDRFKR